MNHTEQSKLFECCSLCLLERTSQFFLAEKPKCFPLWGWIACVLLEWVFPVLLLVWRLHHLFSFSKHWQGLVPVRSFQYIFVLLSPLWFPCALMYKLIFRQSLSFMLPFTRNSSPIFTDIFSVYALLGSCWPEMSKRLVKI